MAGNARSEFDGTNGNDGDAISGASVDPATLTGGTGPGDEPYDADIHTGPADFNRDGSRRRKRGRKPGGNRGSGPGPRKASSRSDIKSSVDTLAKTLMVFHQGIAVATSTPEMMIDQDEGEILARATVNVLDQYDFTPDPKIQAIIGMVMAAGTVYAPRVVLIRARLAQQAKEREAGTAGVYGPGGEAMGTTTFATGNGAAN